MNEWMNELDKYLILVTGIEADKWLLTNHMGNNSQYREYATHCILHHV